MNDGSLINRVTRGLFRQSFIGLYFLIFSVSTVNAQTLDLKGAVEEGLAHNQRIHQYEDREAQRKADDRTAIGNFWPSVKVEAGYTHLNDPLMIDLDPLRQALIQIEAGNQVEYANIYGLLQGHPPLTAEQRTAVAAQATAAYDSRLPLFQETLKDQNYPSATVTLVQPLFTGGQLLAARRAASAEWNVSRAELEKVRQETVQEVINQYLNVVLLTDVVKTRKDVLDGIRRHRDHADLLYKEGLIPHSDLTRADVAVAEAVRNLGDDEDRLALARTALAYAMGVPENTRPEVRDTLRFFVINDSLDVFLAGAEKQQPIFSVLSNKEFAAAQKVAAEKGQYLPQIAFFGKYEVFPDYLSALEPQWAIGLKATYTLFNGFQRHHRLQSAYRLRDEVRHLDDYTHNQIALLVNKSYSDLRRAENRYRKLETDLTLAQENLRLTEKRYETGLGTSLDVIDAHLVWEKTRVERLVSLHEYYQAAGNLFTATGRPLEFVRLWMEKTIEP